MLFREHVLSDVLPHLHNKNDNAHKLFFTSSQNSTFSLKDTFKVSSSLEDGLIYEIVDVHDERIKRRAIIIVWNHIEPEPHKWCRLHHPHSLRQYMGLTGPRDSTHQVPQAEDEIRRKVQSHQPILAMASLFHVVISTTRSQPPSPTVRPWPTATVKFVYSARSLKPAN